jgi:hypothetical protein
MSYADALRAATPTLEAAATLIEGLLARYDIYTSTSTISTTSTSLTDMTGAEVSVTPESGDLVLLFGQYTFSHGTNEGTANINLTRDGSTITDSQRSVASRADTAGADSQLTVIYIEAPAAGAHTYKMQWATAAGTLYSSRQRLIALVLRNS